MAGGNSMNLLEVQGLSKTFDGPQGEVQALDNINFQVKPGEFISAVGPSGCGKSTLLKIVAGLLPATTGEVELDGQVIQQPKRDIGFMFQTAVLFPWRTAMQNVLLPGEVYGKSRSELEDEAHEIMQAVELRGFEKSYPWQLSGGMQQRVALARTLLYKPRLLLMDEPFGALDEFTREKMNDLLLDLWSKHKNTVIFITHNIQEAVYLADRVFIMTPRPGRLVKELPVDLPRPRSFAMTKRTEFTDAVFEVREHLGVAA